MGKGLNHHTLPIPNQYLPIIRSRDHHLGAIDETYLPRNIDLARLGPFTHPIKMQCFIQLAPASGQVAYQEVPFVMCKSGPSSNLYVSPVSQLQSGHPTSD